MKIEEIEEIEKMNTVVAYAILAWNSWIDPDKIETVDMLNLFHSIMKLKDPAKILASHLIDSKIKNHT